MPFKGKTAIVTGSSRGIGFGIAQVLASRGANVVLNGRDPVTLDSALAKLGAEGERLGSFSGDVSTADVAKNIVDYTVERFGGVDVLVNNAGSPSPMSHFLEISEEHWDAVMSANLRGPFLCSRAAAQVMANAGHGNIVHISSMAAVRAHRNMAAYDVSKAGVEALTRSMALDLAPFGIRVNAVSPGPIHTGNEPNKDDRAALVPLKRIGIPLDIGKVVAFLASDESSFVTGEIIYADGGFLTQLRPLSLDLPWPDSIARRMGTQNHGG